VRESERATRYLDGDVVQARDLLVQAVRRQLGGSGSAKDVEKARAALAAAEAAVQAKVATPERLKALKAAVLDAGREVTRYANEHYDELADELN
jgi:hypothetical protein